MGVDMTHTRRLSSLGRHLLAPASAVDPGARAGGMPAPGVDGTPHGGAFRPTPTASSRARDRGLGVMGVHFNPLDLSSYAPPYSLCGVF